MNNNVLLSLMQKLQNGNSEESSNQQNTQPLQQNSNLSDYPDVFFTNTKNVATTQEFQNNLNTNPQNNVMQNNGMFNQNSLLQILPMLLNNKTGNANMGKLLENINPQFSQIMSLFSNGGKNKKDTQPKNENKANIIDISEFKEIK